MTISPARRVLVPALLLALVAGSSVAQSPLPDPEVARLEREVRAIRDADSVVVARVVRVHPSPGVWCGIVVTRQQVTYRVQHTLCGAPLAGEIRVGHLLVAGSPLVCEHTPLLRPERVFPGARARLCLTRDAEDGFTVRDETYGARFLGEPRVADPEQAAIVQLAVALPALQPWLHLERAERRPVRVRLDDVVPLPLAVTAGGEPVAFLPAELLRDDAHLVFRKLTIQGARADVAFELPAEGVVGTLVCVCRDGRWAVAESELGER